MFLRGVFDNFQKKSILRRDFEGPNAEVPRWLREILRNVNFTRVKRSRNLGGALRDFSTQLSFHSDVRTPSCQRHVWGIKCSEHFGSFWNIFGHIWGGD